MLRPLYGFVNFTLAARLVAFTPLGITAVFAVRFTALVDGHDITSRVNA